MHGTFREQKNPKYKYLTDQIYENKSMDKIFDLRHELIDQIEKTIEQIKEDIKEIEHEKDAASDKLLDFFNYYGYSFDEATMMVAFNIEDEDQEREYEDLYDEYDKLFCRIRVLDDKIDYLDHLLDKYKEEDE